MVKRIPYNKGTDISPVAFLFACPGQKEEKSGKVVTGNTGKNLDLLLSSLSQSSDPAIRSIFPSSNRYDYLITNASDIVHYPALDGKSVPSREEMTEEININRLFYELENAQYVVTFGVQAREAARLVSYMFEMREIYPRPKFISSLPHLSFLSLNQITNDVEGNEIPKGDKSATAKRIAVVKEMLEKEILDV